MYVHAFVEGRHLGINIICGYCFDTRFIFLKLELRRDRKRSISTPGINLLAKKQESGSVL